ncbi:cell wall protein IFF7-like [Helianthus annuus]|uniref:cell wall protein IFF7-like n=1 Tax=Helianthus annuus TaxID=4232 RepID=UPI000B907451|nr:cell wall protein IFF7-like [Helianthus annuus]
MAFIFHKPVAQEITREEILSVFCTPECRERVERKDVIKLKDDVSVKTTQLLYVLEKLCTVTKELEDIRDRYQINELNIKKFDSSSKLVKKLCDQQLAYKKRKGCGLGYNQAPPPYNDNYTYLPMTEEELMNESKMTYGSKNNNSSINCRPVDKGATPSVNFVSKGTFDPNALSSYADKISEVKCGDVLGSEPVVHSSFFENYFEQTKSDIAFGRTLFESFCAYVSSGEPDAWGKTESDDCDSVNACDCNVSNVSVDDSVTGEVPHDTFSETTETSSQENQDGTPLETVDESKAKSDSHDTCVNETCVDEISTCSKIETESESIKEEKGVEINEQSPKNVSENKDKTETPVFQNDHDKSEKDESHHQSTSHACASSDQQMPPRRDQTENAALAATIIQQMTAVIPNLITQINQANNNNNNNNAQCDFKTFNSAKPSKFSRSQGATALLQWFESIESTFHHVQCANERKVDFASSVFQRRALTWWNGIMRD